MPTPPATRALAVRYIPFDVTTPAGTLQAAPLTTPSGLSDCILIGVDLRIPPGHSGLTGMRLDYSGTTILPFSNPSQYIIGDNDFVAFEVGFQVGGLLKAVTYNTDVYAHTHYMLLKVTDLGEPVSAPVEFVTVAPVTDR